MYNLKELYNHYYSQHGQGHGREIYKAIEIFINDIATMYPEHTLEIQSLGGMGQVLRMNKNISEKLTGLFVKHTYRLESLLEIEKNRTMLEQGLLYAKHPDKEERKKYLIEKLKEKNKQIETRFKEEFGFEFPEIKSEELAKEIKQEKRINERKKQWNITDMKDSNIL